MGVLAAMLLVSQSPAHAVPDLLVEIDNTVASMHDFSVTSARIGQNSSPQYISTVLSAMNSQLSKIRNNITTLDKNLAKNWAYLGKTPNYTYPDRDTMHNFDSQVFAWYNFEVKQQQELISCLKKSANDTSAKTCVLKLKNKNKKAEGLLYAKISKTLTTIEVWRKAAKR